MNPTPQQIASQAKHDAAAQAVAQHRDWLDSLKGEIDPFVALLARVVELERTVSGLLPANVRPVADTAADVADTADKMLGAVL